VTSSRPSVTTSTSDGRSCRDEGWDVHACVVVVPPCVDVVQAVVAVVSPLRDVLSPFRDVFSKEDADLHVLAPLASALLEGVVPFAHVAQASADVRTLILEDLRKWREDSQELRRSGHDLPGVAYEGLGVSSDREPLLPWFRGGLSLTARDLRRTRATVGGRGRSCAAPTGRAGLWKLGRPPRDPA
jgi:hypothetical protein